ncbi:MAG: hypothetical protein FJX77_11990, partial [Armatimonadetes bacterium]|nr:hypothetical protein [Armatimonadota bacterium]
MILRADMGDQSFPTRGYIGWGRARAAPGRPTSAVPARHGRRGRFWLCLTMVLMVLVPVCSQDGTVTLSPEQPYQGEALFVELDSPGAEEPSATWQKATYELEPGDDDTGWLAVLPVAPDTPQGGHTLLVGYRQNGEARSVSRQVEVRRTRYRVQHLRMARATAGLYSFPGVKQEDATVGAAIRSRTRGRSWRGDWALPVRGRLSTPFGVRRYRNGKLAGRHSGTDIAAPTGTSVRAPASGRVELTRKFRKYGGTVVL